MGARLALLRGRSDHLPVPDFCSEVFRSRVGKTRPTGRTFSFGPLEEGQEIRPNPGRDHRCHGVCTCWLSISSECAGGGSLRCRESSRALSLMVLGGRDVRAQARGLVGREVHEIDRGVTLSGRGQRVRVCAWSEGLESEALLTRGGRPNVRRDFCSSRRSRSVTVAAGASWQCPATKLAGQVHPRAGLGGLRRGHRRPALGVRSREDEARG